MSSAKSHELVVVDFASIGRPPRYGWSQTLDVLAQHTALKSAGTDEARRTTDWKDVARLLDGDEHRATGSLARPWNYYIVGCLFDRENDFGCCGGRRTRPLLGRALDLADDVARLGCWELVTIGKHGFEGSGGGHLWRDRHWNFGVGPAWRTWFGPACIDHLGRDRIEQVPAAVIRPSGSGILVQLTEAPEDPAGWPGGATFDRVKAYWGPDFFTRNSGIKKWRPEPPPRLEPIPQGLSDLMAAARSVMMRLGWEPSAAGLERITQMRQRDVIQAVKNAWPEATMSGKELAPIVLGVLLGDTVRALVPGAEWGWHESAQTVAVSPLPGRVSHVLPLNTAIKWVQRVPNTDLGFWLRVATAPLPPDTASPGTPGENA